MGILNKTNNYKTIRVRFEHDICYIQIYRPEANNTINNDLIYEFSQVLSICDAEVKIVVLEGLPEVFCFGADFQGLGQESEIERTPEPLYKVWLQLATGSYITIAHVRGQVNAGGIGFVAACDVVLSDEEAVFSLSELLFGLMPACVLPFLIRRMDYSKANYMTLMTQPISAKQAQSWGLVDAVGENSEDLLRRHLLRLRKLPKKGIARYKRYINTLNETLVDSKPAAIEANREVFSDIQNIELIARYVNTGKFPWEED